jgi:hypothetical protein
VRHSRRPARDGGTELAAVRHQTFANLHHHVRLDRPKQGEISTVIGRAPASRQAQCPAASAPDATHRKAPAKPATSRPPRSARAATGFDFKLQRRTRNVGPPQGTIPARRSAARAPVYRAPDASTECETRRNPHVPCRSSRRGWEGGRAEAARWMRYRVPPRLADGRIDPLSLSRSPTRCRRSVVSTSAPAIRSSCTERTTS